ncbi:glycoside hydrolase family 2 TIM barrel-domain containing protein [Candidatus Kapabacteria bacterium]|nr:glycoside hydrolase family 2 TIM barrel-domain containing protein [Candidatus Kapabacteria bacterium]
MNSIYAQGNKVKVISDSNGQKLKVDGKDFMVNGMNWDYMPIGTNYSYDFWSKPDSFIRQALDNEMSLLKNMGVNTIRVYTGMPAKWITYIYENYGIYTMLNHSFGRYGVTIGGAWVSNTNYADEGVRELLLSEVTQMVEQYKDTPGLLLFLLGNENNYGLFWDGAETEDIPVDKRKSTKRAIPMYQLFNEAAKSMKKIDNYHPIAMCNGDLLFIDIIAKECNDVDIYGTNMYRGISFTDAFEIVKDKLNKPILFTEFGSDALNSRTKEESQKDQARYLVANWKEIYENAYGIGNSNNSIGGFTFQFSDGWWKYGQTKNLDNHDKNASWSNGGYTFDFENGENNMNEEWFGICAKGKTNSAGLYQLYPRAAYYALEEAHKLDPYSDGNSQSKINNHFDNIKLVKAVGAAKSDYALMMAQKGSPIRISGLRANFTTYSTGGNKILTPSSPSNDYATYPNQLGFDHMQSFFAEVEASPNDNLRAKVSFNILGNVAENPIDQIFYENRGRRANFETPDGQVTVGDLERVRIYGASIDWSTKYFDVNGFYRTGHYHWGYEGDFFGLYREANYGPNIDIYNGNAPLGFEFSGKRSLNGLKVAFGPELWWGANPALLLKYTTRVGMFDFTGMYHEDVDNLANTESSFAVPSLQNRRSTLHLATKLGNLGVEVGGIWAGSPQVGQTFQVVDGESGNYTVYEDQINDNDTWGGKFKLTYTGSPINWYLQGSAMGLVALGGADQTQTFAGWRLRDVGMGNMYNLLAGFTFSVGNLQIAPNFLWQKPIEDPIPADAPAPARPRNVLNDPFLVRGNRETTSAELLLTYDPTPATWMYEWNNDMVEDAPFAISAGFIFRHHPTSMDAAIGILGDGRTLFAFNGAAPAADLWESNIRIISNINNKYKLVANLIAGTAQSNGDDGRMIHRWGGDFRIVRGVWRLMGAVKVNDWGPFDYHRDFNLTFPLQLIGDISTTVDASSWFTGLPQTKLGIMCTWRSLNRYSPRYSPTMIVNDLGELENDPEAVGFGNGNEWEIRTYLNFNLRN